MAIVSGMLVFLISDGTPNRDIALLRTGGDSSGTNPIALVEPTTVDFGVVSPGDVITNCITIRNRSARSLRVLAAETGSRGPRFDPGRFDIEPMSDEFLSVTIRSSAEGQYTTTGAIYTDDPNNHTVQVEFNYTIAPKRNGV